jgi:hypothetical protein
VRCESTSCRSESRDWFDLVLRADVQRVMRKMPMDAQSQKSGSRREMRFAIIERHRRLPPAERTLQFNGS